jgi:uncharacterized protein YecE (DUF72 family)
MATAGKIRVGIGGWNYAPWRDNFYPTKWPQDRELEYAAEHLTAIEVNSTFYRPQKAAVYAKWRKQTPDGFVFSLKAPRFAAQSKVLANGRKSIDAFVFGGIAELGDRLGPISWQFAPERPFEREDFADFLDLLPRELNGRRLRHVLEVRHPSFMSDVFLALARSHEIPVVYTDSPEYPSFGDITADFVYARLMRSQSALVSGYPEKALDAWATRARDWASGKAPPDLHYVQAAKPKVRARDVFIFFISAAKERNPAAAQALIARVST